MNHDHWYYFLALEQDFEATTRYVEPCVDNYGTYSIEYAKILLGICSEIDVVAKVLYEKIKPGSNPGNIDDYRATITNRYRKFHTFTAVLPRYATQLTPWHNWGTSVNPGWWKGYNSVKHERHQNFHLANLENCINALAGLFALVLYLYHDELYALKLDPWARSLALPSEPDRVVAGNYELPDFPLR